MILHVPNVLNEQQVAHCRDVIEHATWVDGRVTAGYQSASVKDNRQLPEDSKEAHELGDMIVAALERHPMFISAALPLRVFPPLFNRYDAGMSFGPHLDNSIRQITGTPYRVRTDISVTLFLSQPEEYDGGELVINDLYGSHAVKLPAGADGPVSGEQSAPCDSGDARYQVCFLLLDSKHGPRRAAAHLAF